MRSHLFMARTTARPASTAFCTTRTSCSLRTSEESTSTTATSARSMAAWVRNPA